MKRRAKKLREFYARLDRVVEIYLDADFAPELRRVRRALID